MRSGAQPTLWICEEICRKDSHPPPFPKDIGAALFQCLEVQGFPSESGDLSDNQA